MLISKKNTHFNIRKSVCLILIFFISILLCACDNQKEEGKYMVYYSNGSADDIIYKEMYIKDYESMEAVNLVNELLKYMYDDESIPEKYYSAKPADVLLNSVSVKDGQVTLDFSKEYYSMTNVREIILRASTVLTLIQVESINGVNFTIEGVPLTNSYGEPIGTMTRDKFVNVLLNEDGMLKQETEVSIFFADETGTALIPITYVFTIDNSNLSMEEYILQKLVEGPEPGVAYRTLSKDVELISVVTTDRICYVNFGNNFLEQNQNVSDEIMIYSIVNSLCELPYVSSVQFLVNGESNITLHKTFDLSKPLVRNLDLNL